MKIAVASSFVPFIFGGGTAIVSDLVRELTARGHEVETIALPFWSDPETMVDQMLGYRLLDLEGAGELLITIRPPSQILRHPNKVLWFIHHERWAYDLWGSYYHHGEPSVHDMAVREAIIAADTEAFASAAKIFTNSEIVRKRVLDYNGVDSTVLYAPLGRPETFSCVGYGDFVFCPSRLTPIKRQDLLISAMAYVETDVRLVLAGKPDQGDAEARRLRALIRRQKLGDRVDLITGWMAEEQKRELFSQALAGAYVPFDEDSYGYTVLESCHSRKPILTCTDSGGTLEIVEDRVTGRVVDPDPRELAKAMDELYSDREQTKRMGEAAEKRVQQLGISWDRVVDALTA